MKELLVAVLFGLSVGACGHKAEPAQGIEGLFAGHAPALVGPVGTLKWGMPYEPLKAGALDANGVTVNAAGIGTPPVLGGVTVRSTTPVDLHKLAVTAWGAPYADLGGGAGIWVSPEPQGTPANVYGDGTRAIVTDVVLLTPYRSLAHWLGAGPIFGFEDTGTLTGTAATDLTKKYATRIQPGSTTIQLGYDELDLWFVSFGYGADNVVHQFGFEIPMPAAARAVRSKLVLDRFGLKELDTTGKFFPLPGGAREASIVDTAGHWSVVVRDVPPATP